jgi:hypothetical protein
MNLQSAPASARAVGNSRFQLPIRPDCGFFLGRTRSLAELVVGSVGSSGFREKSLVHRGPAKR